MSKFLDQESQELFSRYNDQTELLNRKGIDSKLKSRLAVFNSTISTANTLGNFLIAQYQSKLTDLDKQKSRRFFGLFRKDPKKLEEQLNKALEEFKKCKTILYSHFLLIWGNKYSELSMTQAKRLNNDYKIKLDDALFPFIN